VLQSVRSDRHGHERGREDRRHEIITRIDAHSMLPDGYLRTAVRTLMETGAADVGGWMAAEGITPFQRAVAWAMTSPFGMGAAANHTGGEAGPPTPSTWASTAARTSRRSAATTRPC
jgi:hypothetical protein